MNNEIKTYAFTPVPAQEKDLETEVELKKEEIIKHGYSIQVDFSSPQICIISSDAPSTLLRFSWVQFEWGEVEEIKCDSISKSSRYLASKGKRWKHLTINAHRRGELIFQNLNQYRDTEINFWGPNQFTESHCFGLLSNEQIIFSKKASLFPGGDIKFIEDKKNPPSRAYLKLWEVFTRFEVLPTANSTCLDMGSCPGGWTWVLAQLGNSVTSVDKAPIDKKLLQNPLVKFKQESAFAINPNDFDDRLTWFFCDIICYPAKLYELVIRWLEAIPSLGFVCTIKFQGETDFKTLKKFQNIPNSKVIHLFHNKHELTWIKTRGTNEIH